ncbi:helicase-related protein [Cerasicoccus maritimus]|uniref:helicase-related protein n=1 Tax=Cerasicoccus maritimus TaxID=490089 RepID=UPI002852802C|nr:helicase-related protein [Cerasicoccus maritimus]
MILEELLCLHADAQTLIYTGSNQMAYELSSRFLIPCLLDHCHSDERAFILEGYREGKFKAIIANQVLDEGIDVPTAKIAIVLGGKSTTRQAIQRLGRILRPSGNAQAILYEIVCDNTGEVQRSRKRRRTDAYQKGSLLPL